LASDPPPTILQHGTTLKRARAIKADGPDPFFREPGSEGLPPAEAFCAVVRDGRRCETATPEGAARDKAALFPEEGGPAILEVVVPGWIMNILDSDPQAAWLARSGEIRFDSECGLDELRAEWRKLTKRVIPL
jgi:hypothetical protein